MEESKAETEVYGVKVAFYEVFCVKVEDGSISM